jgi:hypothetical protein
VVRTHASTAALKFQLCCFNILAAVVLSVGAILRNSATNPFCCADDGAGAIERERSGQPLPSTGGFADDARAVGYEAA